MRRADAKGPQQADRVDAAEMRVENDRAQLRGVAANDRQSLAAIPRDMGRHLERLQENRRGLQDGLVVIDAQDVARGDVLVVDNDEAILKTTSILLKAVKLTPHVARDRREALAVVRRYAEQLKAIILDAHLGGIDTVRLLGAFRLGAPRVPVIVSSGSSSEEIARMFEAHPYDAFLAKPYTVPELKAAIARAAGGAEY